MPRFKRRSKNNILNNKQIALNDNGGNGNNGNGTRNRKLTPLRLRFIDEYLIDLNATQAAIRAGYSKNGAEVQGSYLLSLNKVQKALQKRRDKLSASTLINQEWVLKRYKMLSDYSVDDFFDDKGELKPLSTIPKDKLYAICGIKTQKTVFTNKDLKRVEEIITKELKLPDKKGVLDSVGRYLGMFEKDNEQKKPIIPIQINVGLAD